MRTTTSTRFSSGRQRLWLIAVVIATVFAVPARSRGAALCDATLDLIVPLGNANANNAADTIDLTAGCVYTLAKANNVADGPNGLPSILDDGPGHGITINGNGATIQRDPALPAAQAFRIFHIASGAALTLTNVLIANGLQQGGSGADAAGAGGGGGGGAAGLGGGIYNAGTLILSTVTISNSQAIGGAGGIGLAGADGSGGAGGGSAGGAGGTVGNPGGPGGANSGGGGGGDQAAGGAGGATGGGGGGSGNNASFSISPGAGDSGGGDGGSGTFSNGGGGGGGGAGLGGGVFNLGTLRVAGATSFLGNQSSGGAGGAGGGSFSDGDNGSGRGGAIYNAGAATLTIDAGTTLRGNVASSGGGGIYSDGAATVAGATFTGNTANGGGFYGVDGGGALAVGSGALAVTGGTFASNSAPNGGALRVAGGALRVAGSTFSNNTATGDYGGGVLFITDGTATLAGSTFSNNSAYEGGALASAADGGSPEISVSGSTFTGNTASGLYGSGGAISSNGALSVDSSTFTGNTTTGDNSDGGAVYLSSGAATIANSTFSENAAVGGGGAIYNRDATLDLLSATIASNISNSGGLIAAEGSNGGGIYSGGAINLQNSIVAENIDRSVAPAGVYPDIAGDFAGAGYNLIGDGAGSTGLADGTNGNQVGASASRLDPLLGPLQNNGGPTATRQPGAASPAIDQGGTAGCPAADQRGVSRPVDLAPANAAGQNGCDIGAVEALQLGAPAVTLSPASLDFGKQPVGLTSVARTVTLTNTGTAPLAIGAIGASGNFAQSSSCPISPATLAAGASCSIDVTFTPASVGAKTGALTISDNAAGSPRSVGLAGEGVVRGSNVFRTYLPIALLAGRPDLVVTNIALEPNKASFAAGEPVQISVTVKNIGAAPSAEAFWVDLYINPAHPPAINDLWHNVCGISPCEGMAWPVRTSLAPGQSITLTSIAGYDPARSYWLGWLPSGTTTIYAYADSWNTSGVVGAVVESDEANNRAVLAELTVSGPNPPIPSAARPAELPGRVEGRGLPPRPELSLDR